jgi:hypothetical protein
MITVWIGGPMGSGKTTVARIIAGRHGLRVFPIDSFWYSHAARLPSPEPSPQEQWLGQTPAEQAASFESLTRHRWPLVLADLAALPPSPAVLVEGPGVLPDLVPAGDPAVFLIATPEFQRSVLEKRPLPPTSDPDRALENRIEKDRLYSVRVSELARERGCRIVRVDGSRPVVDLVEEALPEVAGLPFHSAEVRAARRWENDVVAGNIRIWLGTAHVPSEVPERYSFACECGQRGCSAMAEMSLGGYDSSGRVLAPGH